MRHRRRHRYARGFSIIELLIAIIIIGILVAVIIPVLLNRAEEARVRAAESDLQHLQDAEERAGINTGYLYRFYVLDDVLGGDGFGPYNPNDYIDGIRDEHLNVGMQFPTRIFIEYKTGQFSQNYQNLYSQLTRNETAFGWQGAYVNYHHLRDIDTNDIAEDPWGEEYLLFTNSGKLVDQFQGILVETFYFFASDTLSTVPIYWPFFDRFTVLSTGANGAPGDGTSNAIFGTDDDLYRQF